MCFELRENKICNKNDVFFFLVPFYVLVYVPGVIPTTWINILCQISDTGYSSRYYIYIKYDVQMHSIFY